ncbi:hypothetical protein ACTA71_000512 [Dictyostelium dimigraforme]
MITNNPMDTEQLEKKRVYSNLMKVITPTLLFPPTPLQSPSTNSGVNNFLSSCKSSNAVLQPSGGERIINKNPQHQEISPDPRIESITRNGNVSVCVPWQRRNCSEPCAPNLRVFSAAFKVNDRSNRLMQLGMLF